MLNKTYFFAKYVMACIVRSITVSFLFHLCNLEINECLDATICENGATCVNTPGSFRCDCVEGWKGSRCEEG